jgi:type III pantothenate kinase
MMQLLVDIGNSRIKWALLDQNLTGHGSVAHDQKDISDLLAENWSALAIPEQIIVSSVAASSLNKTLDDWISHNWKLKPVYAQVSHSAFGVQNAYSDVSEYGIDRWMALIAAWKKYQSPVCVVDCGTAVTIDVLKKNGIHKGGLIVPGLNTMQQSLFKQTSGIPESIDPASVDLAINTRQAVANGCALALVSLVEHVINTSEVNEGENIMCLLTGGEAELISDLLKARHSIEPHLVLEGLAIYAANLE